MSLVFLLVNRACSVPQTRTYDPAMATSEELPGYVRMADVAAYIDRTERTVRNRIARVGVQTYRDASGRTVIRVEDLDRLNAPVPIPRADAD